MENVEVLSFLDENVIRFDDMNIDDFLLKHLGQGKVCFTGSRPMSLPWKFNENCNLFIEFKQRLSGFIEKLIDAGFNHFITGMALGFDTYVARIVLEMKKTNRNLKLECAVPFVNQAMKWSPYQKEEYLEILNNADIVTEVSQAYFAGCYQKRNLYMVENSSLIVSLITKEDGGSVATTKLAMKKGLGVVFIE